MQLERMKTPGFMVLLESAKPYRWVLLAVMLLMLAGSALALLNPWLAGLVTRELLITMNDNSTITRLLGLWLLVLFIQGCTGFGHQYLAAVTGEKLVTVLRVRLYDHIQSLPLDYFDERRRGELLSLLTYETDIIGSFLTGTLVGLLPQIITLCGALVFIYLIDPVIAGLAGLSVPLFFLLMKILGRRIRPISTAIQQQYADIYSMADENLQMLPVIKSYTRELLESVRFQQHNRLLLDLNIRYLSVQSMLAPVIQFLAAGAILIVLWVSVPAVQSGRIDAAELVSLLLYGMLLVRPVSGLADIYGQIQRTRGAAERLVEIFAINPEPADIGNPDLPESKGAIEFRDVYFGYPDRQQLFCGLNLKIKPGETVAITGENGAGKSTLVHLLLRFRAPDKGNVLIDGIDISKVNIYSLRSQIGVVQQQILLMNSSVRENLCVGRPHADDAEIIRAAESARAMEFIRSLPQGLDTIIGDQGVKLSGGQKQRLALARALLKNPPVLVLDEATAMFDPDGEKSFIAECHEILKQRTVILITHRPASLALADRVLKLENGVIQTVNTPSGQKVSAQA